MTSERDTGRLEGRSEDRGQDRAQDRGQDRARDRARGHLVGMVHLLPLPGSPRWGGSMDAVLLRARADARALVTGGLTGGKTHGTTGGMDAVLVENFGDVPFLPGRVAPETCAALSLAVAAVLEEVAEAAAPRRIPVGVNVLRNDAATALAVAAVTGASFIRVNVHTGSMFTDQGLLEGEAHATLRRRATLAPGVGICADVHVKHATPPAGASLEEAALDTLERGLADVLIVSGSGTGRPVDVERLRRVRAVAPGAHLWVGSGVTPGSARSLLEVADGVIVGSALEEGGRAGAPVDPARVRAFLNAARPGYPVSETE